MAPMSDARTPNADAADETTDLRALRAAAEQFAARRGRDGRPDAVERALPVVLGTVLGGLALAALGGLTGVVSLNAAAVVLGLAAAAGTAVGLVRLGEQQAQREAAARGQRDAAAEELLAAVDRALTHVERLDRERDRLNRRIARLERRLASKERQLARLQAFDAERRALDPAPAEEPQAQQLTLEAILAAQEAEAAGEAAVGASGGDGAGR